MERSFTDDKLWTIVIPLPAFAQIAFKFVVNGEGVVSDYYTIVRQETTESGTAEQFNFFAVQPHDTKYLANEVIGKMTVPIVDANSQVKVVPNRVIGKFHGVQLMTREKQEEQFRHDWSCVILRDIGADSKAVEERCRVALTKYLDKLPFIFRKFSLQGKHDNLMSSLAFFNFCHTCKIIGKNVTVSQVDRIWHRVNLMETWTADSDQNGMYMFTHFSFLIAHDLFY